MNDLKKNNMELEKILFNYFGISEFRDKQKETIECLLNDQNTLCLMPTGMGKSLIYQVATIVKGKNCSFSDFGASAIHNKSLEL